MKIKTETTTPVRSKQNHEATNLARSNSSMKQQTQAPGDGLDWTQVANIGSYWDRDEVMVCLLGLVLQVPIDVFVGFGFTGSDQCICCVWVWSCWWRPVKDLKVRPRRMLYSPMRNWRWEWELKLMREELKLFVNFVLLVLRNSSF